MKICIYNLTTGHVRGGMETYCLEIGRALARRGHRVTQVAGRGARIPSDEGVRVVTRPFRHRSTFPAFGKTYRKLMERLSFGRTGRRLLADGSWDGVIVAKPLDFPVLAWARRHGMRARTLYHAGGTDFYPGDRLFAGAVDHWVACSECTARSVGERYRRPVRTMPLGVDIGRFRPGPRDPAWRASLGVPEGAPVVMSVGRLIAWKGLGTVIEAVSGLPRVFYVVVGEGDERPGLEARAARLGVSDRVRFGGGADHERIPALLREADVFVQPSIGPEAFGISVVEAMATGLPVIASRNGGMVEILTDGVDGRLVPPGDVTAWRDALREVLADGSLSSALGPGARRAVESRYTWMALAAETEKLLEGVVCAEQPAATGPAAHR